MRSYYGSVYEHQSTYCPNMPLRDLLYFASIIQKRIKAQKRDIYGGKLLKIPIPHFVVFYNGKEEAPETAADSHGGFYYICNKSSVLQPKTRANFTTSMSRSRVLAAKSRISLQRYFFNGQMEGIRMSFIFV